MIAAASPNVLMALIIQFRASMESDCLLFNLLLFFYKKNWFCYYDLRVALRNLLDYMFHNQSTGNVYRTSTPMEII